MTTPTTSPDMMTAASVTLRLLDPTPLTSAELDAHMEWGRLHGGDIVGFRHPLAVGWEQTEEHARTLNMPTTRQVIADKHEHLHAGPGHLPLHGRLWWFERPFRPWAAMLLVRKGQAPPDPRHLADWIIGLWCDTEFPQQHGAWADLLGAVPAGGPWGDIDLLDDSGTTVVYRGIGDPEPDDLDVASEDDGWAWTTDYDRAVWFARRFPHRGLPLVIHGTVPNDRVLFATRARGEDEIVSCAVQVHTFEEINDG